jgi:hypothetical protein
LDEKTALTAQNFEDEKMFHVDFQHILTNLKFYGMLVASLIMIGKINGFRLSFTQFGLTLV